MNETAPQKFDLETDIIIAGYGFAGAVAAIEAADAGARVMVLEKMPDAGGISICSAGSARTAHDATEAFKYLAATNAGRTPDTVLQVLADGMTGIGDYMAKLAGDVGYTVSDNANRQRNGANYPLPGWQTFYHTLLDDIPGFDAEKAYPHVSGLAGGRRLFHMLEANIAKRDIDVRLDSPVLKLITEGPAGAAKVIGAVAVIDGKPTRIAANKAVILATGGFETNEDMKSQFWQMTPVLPAMGRQNTGDGIRMAQSLGARLWHMWHFHGAYGFKDPSGEFPYGIRLKRLPDWVPTDDERVRARMVWILVDQNGRRFMNENPPYTQDTTARNFERFDTITQTFPRIPAYLICDEEGRKSYRLADPCYNERGLDFKWSEDNLTEIDNGILKRADSIEDLAVLIGVGEGVLSETIERWNTACQAERDDDFGRMPGSFAPIRTPPFYVGEVWPVVSNTQGGPEHDASQRIIDVDGDPIPGLYAAGEMGSAFGHLYLSGSNITECFVTGRVAAQHAAALD